MTDNLAAHMDVIPAPVDAWPWILETFRGQLDSVPGGPAECAVQQKRALARILQTCPKCAVVAVPRGYPTEFAGWAAALNGALLFAYVRADFRQQGIGAKMLCDLPLRLPVEVAYWTDAAEAIAAHGFELRYSIQAYRSLLAFVRGTSHHRTHARAA